MSIRRIIVVQESAEAARALDAVAEAAATLEAELTGLFVENEELLHFAAMPFAREIGAFSAQALDVPTMERRLRYQAEEARRALAAAAEGKPLRWSFRIERGSLPAQVRNALDDADLVVLLGGRPSRRRAAALLSAAELPREVESALEHLARSLAGEFYRVRPAEGEEVLARLLRELRRGGAERG
ncbi:MAG TPA: hypothetical protein VLV56_04475 [Burkholderiales bacterium]|nr:hypothetical protein [Burkholderiales bacterium]